MRAIGIVAGLTLREAARRRVLAAALGIALAFVVVYAIGFHFVVLDANRDTSVTAAAQRRFIAAFFTLLGLYAANFLASLSAVLLPIDTLSGEIASGVAQTLAVRPVRRSEVVLGKWIAYVGVVWGYLLIAVAGVLLVARLSAGYVPPHLERGVPLLMLESAVLVTLSIAGGARLATVTNGLLAFGLYGIAFLGGWVEQVGGWTHNAAARDVGTIASLVMPTESLWRLAAHLLQPPFLAQMRMSPFAMGPVPSALMVAWAGLWIVAALALAVRGFGKRPL